MTSLTTAWRWALVKAFQGIMAHKGLTVLAFIITTLALSCPLIAYTLARSIYASVSSISPAQEITIFTTRGTGIAQVSELRKAIAGNSCITATRIVPPEEALAMLGQDSDPARPKSSDNPLPYIVLASVDTTASDSTVANLVQSIESEKNVDSVAFDSTWNSRLAAIRRTFAEFGIATGCILGAMLLFVLICSASLTTMTTPGLASSLRTMGASPAFISRPDAWRGAILFLGASFASLLLSSFITNQLAGSVTKVFSLYGLQVAPEPIHPLWQAAFILFMTFLGAFFSGISSLLENRPPRGHSN